jgi:hypothetical protein
MRRNAGLARAEDRVHAVETGYRGAAAAGVALIAGRRGVVKLIAARPFQKNRRRPTPCCAAAPKLFAEFGNGMKG